jgi:hypothetical protein
LEGEDLFSTENTSFRGICAAREPFCIRGKKPVAHFLLGFSRRLLSSVFGRRKSLGGKSQKMLQKGIIFDEGIPLLLGDLREMIPILPPDVNCSAKNGHEGYGGNVLSYDPLFLSLNQGGVVVMVKGIFSQLGAVIAFQKSPVGDAYHGGILPVEVEKTPYKLLEVFQASILGIPRISGICGVSFYDGSLHGLIELFFAAEMKENQRARTAALFGNVSYGGSREAFLGKKKLRSFENCLSGSLRISGFMGLPHEISP